MRQQALGTATPKNIEDRIQDLTLGICLRPSTGSGRGHQMYDQAPFFVVQVGWVGFAGFHTPKLPQIVAPRQPF